MESGLTPREEDEIMSKALKKAFLICFGGLLVIFIIFVILTLVYEQIIT